jgi:hypothetical protein
VRTQTQLHFQIGTRQYPSLGMYFRSEEHINSSLPRKGTTLSSIRNDAHHRIGKGKGKGKGKVVPVLN